ncbi:hypothetical protein GCM10010967_54920 [Dyadobacter beijingensis]|uniref:Secreted protein (Por secretion system target) n=1 Tax=Dyadobacter beijingensis TaxID=365489 RepID=A0ABQ2IK57_9BACT|nr:S8 family serine peptidase [Dyadobacter beijingensis]GGN11968.1 hypothetical protein GCM10010967_54920 [Dyadobacter beijingensis]
MNLPERFGWLTLLLVLLHAGPAMSQRSQPYKLYLRSGTISPAPNLENIALQARQSRVVQDTAPRLVIIQFYDIPKQETVQMLAGGGIRLLEYVPDFAYTASVTPGWDAGLLKTASVRAVIDIEPRYKIEPALLGANIPPHAVKEAGTVDVRVNFIQGVSIDGIKNDLSAMGVRLISDGLAAYQVLEVRAGTGALESLAGLSWVQYIEAVPPVEELLNDKSEAGTRANVLASGLPGQRGLTGEGVVVGIGDSGNLLEHIDIRTRLVSNEPESTYWHGVHVTGTAAGGGIINEKYKGYAPKASLIKRSNSEIWKQATVLTRDYGMVITTNSYGGSLCPDFGSYTFDSYMLDRQANELPNLQHVFAAGNSGLEASCGFFPAGYGNVIGGNISSKNVVTVGRTGTNGLIHASSSRGPTLDGRIKPEIIAPGTSIYSTIPTNTYASASGTSMAAPAVSGGLALLYQRYRQLNGGSNPKNMLMKAVLLNGAYDRGLAGPDFTYGFGVMNLLRSVDMLEKGRYFNGRIANQAKDGFEITVPANTAQVKVMLYWNDPAPATISGPKSLVNDLDLKVIRGVNTEVLPVFPRPAAPQDLAAPGIDSLNNVEQIVLDAPAAGNYVINVVGKKVPSGPQEYFVVYDVIENSSVLTNPVGGERFTKNDVIDISWDNYGSPNSTYAVAYSLNDGANWTTLSPSVPEFTNQLSWTIPDASTTTAKVRIIRNGTGVVKESAAFTIMNVPVISLSANQCESYAAVQWTAVSGATDYEVMRMKGNEMRSVGTTTDTKYVLSGLSRDSTYYISVRARINGVPGRRAVAISRKPDSGNCQGIISDGDLAVETIISPSKSGRLLTSGSLPEAQVVKVALKNLDDQPVTQSFQVGYALGNGATHWETVDTDIPAFGSLDYAFNQTINLQAAGAYSLAVSVKLEGDQVAANNQKSISIRQLANAPVTLPFTDNLETLNAEEVSANTMGIGGSDRYDFSQERDLGRVRTTTDPVLAYSGSKSFTIDANNAANSSYPTTLEATYNLASYHADRDEVRLAFRYRMYAAPTSAWPLRVYVRGKDTDPWLPALESASIPYFAKDNNYALAAVEVSDVLKRSGQDFSTSFQVKWEQSFRYRTQTDGATIDDIRLYKAAGDLEIARVTASSTPSCDVNGYQEYSIQVKNNSSDDYFKMPFEAQINGRLIDIGQVPVVRAGRDTVINFSFSSTYFLNSDREVKILLKRAFDTNTGNDFATTTAKAAQVITAYPYLQDFENGQGGWYVGDAAALWRFGKPASGRVTEAASGSNAWIASPAAGSESTSYLYSPCFAMSGMAQPALSFSVSIDLAACAGGNCDIAYVEYNVSGNTWMRLGGMNSGTNWYNARQENADAWNVQDYTRWHVATVPVPNYFPSGYVRFRFVLKSKSASGRSGIAIDDIHIYDSQAMVYASNTQDNTTMTADLFGDQWIPYKLYNSMLVAINPHGQSMGQVSVKTYLDNGPMRIQSRQYYLGRNFTITTADARYAQPVGVRLYITDEETERLINAPEKAGIARPGSAYDLTITKYSGENEDGNIANNGSVAWSFLTKSEVKKVPYAQGYYLEFSVKSFSEFWFAKEFVGPGTPLPVKLASISVTPVEHTARLDWATAEEENVRHFEIQRSSDARTWTALPGQVPAVGEGGHRYQAIDPSPSGGINYYRLKMVDMDDTFAYSQIVSADFGTEASVTLFPNPVTDRLNIRTAGRRLTRVRLHSLSGQEVMSGGEGTQSMDVSRLTSGVHWVSIQYADGSRSNHKIIIVH